MTSNPHPLLSNRNGISATQTAVSGMFRSKCHNSIVTYRKQGGPTESLPLLTLQNKWPCPEGFGTKPLPLPVLCPKEPCQLPPWTISLQDPGLQSEKLLNLISKWRASSENSEKQWLCSDNVSWKNWGLLPEGLSWEWITYALSDWVHQWILLGSFLNLWDQPSSFWNALAWMVGGDPTHTSFFYWIQSQAQFASKVLLCHSYLPLFF